MFSLCFRKMWRLFHLRRPVRMGWRKWWHFARMSCFRVGDTDLPLCAFFHSCPLCSCFRADGASLDLFGFAVVFQWFLYGVSFCVRLCSTSPPAETRLTVYRRPEVQDFVSRRVMTTTIAHLWHVFSIFGDNLSEYSLKKMCFPLNLFVNLLRNITC